MQGVVKVYDPSTGIGTIMPDDRSTEIVLTPGALQGSLFRTLRQGQRIIFDTREEDGRLFAERVRLGTEDS